MQPLNTGLALKHDSGEPNINWGDCSDGMGNSATTSLPLARHDLEGAFPVVILEQDRPERGAIAKAEQGEKPATAPEHAVLADQVAGRGAPSTKTSERDIAIIDQPGVHRGRPDPVVEVGENHDALLYYPERIYGFSREVTMAGAAVSLSPVEACVARYIAHKVKTSRHTHEGRKWFYESAKNLSQRIFPFIHEKTLSASFRRLANLGVIFRGNFNKLKGDRTTWFSMDQEWMDKVEKNIIYFRLGDAVKYGLCEAVLLRNLEYWLNEENNGDPASGWHVMRPTVLSRRLPFSLSTIRRALRSLTTAGAIIARDNRKEKCGEYRLATDIGKTNRKVAVNPLEIAAGTPAILPTPDSAPLLELQEGQSAAHLMHENRELLHKLKNEQVLAFAEAGVIVARPFINALGDEEIAQRLGAKNPDELLKIVRSRLKVTNLPEIVVQICQEILLIAIGAPSWIGPASHPLLLRSAYQLGLEVFQRKEEWIAQEKQSQYSERQRELASVDLAREDSKELSPAEKKRILRNGINARNQTGFLDESRGVFIQFMRLVLDFAKATKQDYAAVEKFFSINREWTPRDFLRILEKCALAWEF